MISDISLTYNCVGTFCLPMANLNGESQLSQVLESTEFRLCRGSFISILTQ